MEKVLFIAVIVLALASLFATATLAKATVVAQKNENLVVIKAKSGEITIIASGENFDLSGTVLLNFLVEKKVGAEKASDVSFSSADFDTAKHYGGEFKMLGSHKSANTIILEFPNNEAFNKYLKEQVEVTFRKKSEPPTESFPPPKITRELRGL